MFLYRMKVAKAVSGLRKIMDQRQAMREEGDVLGDAAHAVLHLWALSDLVIVIAEAVCVTMSQVENLRRETEKGG